MSAAFPVSDLQLESITTKLVREYSLASEALTERQLASAIAQALRTGDFQRYIAQSGASQAVIYTPGRELDALRIKYSELLCAVKNCHKDESCHDAALRMIQEAQEGYPYGE